MAKRIYFHGGRNEARAIAFKLARTLVGKESDELGIAKSVFTSLGFAALGNIHDAYEKKMHGGLGDDGVKWPPLAPQTIARRRFGPGERKELLEKAGLKSGHRFKRGLNTDELTAEQKKAYQKAYKAAFSRSMVSHGDDVKAKKYARTRGLEAVRKAGAELQRHASKVSVFGGRKVDILRDTGVMFNSLSPGSITGGDLVAYTPSTSDQAFKLLSNGVVVGTNVKYAAFHQEGTSRIPARPFLPDRLPEPWAEDWLDTMSTALTNGAELAFKKR